MGVVQMMLKPITMMTTCTMIATSTAISTPDKTPLRRALVLP
jgi:hypothetical protein